MPLQEHLSFAASCVSRVEAWLKIGAYSNLQLLKIVVLASRVTIAAVDADNIQPLRALQQGH